MGMAATGVYLTLLTPSTFEHLFSFHETCDMMKVSNPGLRHESGSGGDRYGQ
jgi:hypothetical protein